MADEFKQQQCELLPCPFCGSAPRLSEMEKKGMFVIECESDDCPVCSAETHVERLPLAVKHWNTRAGQPPASSEDEHVPVVRATDTEAKVNQAIKAPMMLKCPADGRLFDITKWEPRVCVGEPVTAKVGVIIRVPDSSR